MVLPSSLGACPERFPKKLFYLYKNSSKKVQELKNLYQILKEQYETYGNDIRPVKSTGTRWVDHCI